MWVWASKRCRGSLQICQGSVLQSFRSRCGRSRSSLEVCGSWKSKEFVKVRVELNESVRSTHGNYDLIYWRSEKIPRRRIELDTKLLIWNFVEKLNILSLSGFSWPEAWVQATSGTRWKDWLHLLKAEQDVLRFGCWVFFRVEAVDFRSYLFPSLQRPNFWRIK